LNDAVANQTSRLRHVCDGIAVLACSSRGVDVVRIASGWRWSAPLPALPTPIDAADQIRIGDQLEALALEDRTRCRSDVAIRIAANLSIM
jgi:hypothetical protein